MAQVGVDRALEIAAAQYRAGRWGDAEAIYRQILGQIPNHISTMQRLAILLAEQKRMEEALPIFRRLVELIPGSAEAHCDLGSALRDSGNPQEAIAALLKAISLNPNLAFAHSNLANVYRDLGRIDEAVAEYRRAIALKPDHATAYSNLGNALGDKGLLAEATAAFERAIELNPNFAPAYSNLGVALLRLNRASEAVARLRKAVELAPDYSDAYTNLGRALEALDQWDAAIAAHERAVAIRPNSTSALCNLGNALRSIKRLDDSITTLRRVIELKPDMWQAHNNLGAALADQGKNEEAIGFYRRALALSPDYSDALSNLAISLINQGGTDEPESLLRKAIEIDPDFPAAHWNLAILLMLRGDFERGLPEYEWRWKVKGVMRGSPQIAQRRWEGRDLNGKTILLHAEQGFGDAIQFVRYIPMVAKRGGRIFLRCPTELKRLFAGMAHVERLIEHQEELPAFDEHCPLLSSMMVFGTDLRSIPADVPYLKPDKALVALWKEKLEGKSSPGGQNAGRRIGLCWSGAGVHVNDMNRSTTLGTFAPLREVPNATFVSLQKGEAANQPAPEGLAMVDLTVDIHDFADTAALIENLDLVMTVDTAVAHLAGAMGKSVWVILPVNPDWRWMYDRSDSPWYPTMRLFRQKKVNGWNSVLEEIVRELKGM